MIENQYTISCAFIGEQQVGKTALINKYFRDFDTPSYHPTIAVEISYSTFQCLQGTFFKVKVWDTSGEDKYKMMVCYHLKNVDVIVLMFDITNRISFQRIDQWINRMKSEDAYPKILILLANRLDVVKLDSNLRKVSKREGEEKAKQINAKYVEFSVKTTSQFGFLQEVFEDILSIKSEKQIQIHSLRTGIDTRSTGEESKGSNSVCNCLIF